MGSQFESQRWAHRRHWPVWTLAWIRNTCQRNRIRWCGFVMWCASLLVRYKEFYTWCYNWPLFLYGNPCQPHLLLPLRNPARNNSWRICVTVFTAVELHSKIRRTIFFYFEYSSKDPDPKIRWESVLDFFIAQDFFLWFLPFFLAFYKTLLYLQYTTGLSYNASLTIIYWEHTTNKA